MTECKQTQNEDIKNLEYLKSLPYQNYLKTAEESGKKFHSLDGEVKRAIIEKAMIHTEAYKFSKKEQDKISNLSSEEKENHLSFIFQKFCTFYAYSDKTQKYHNGFQDIINEYKDFHYTYPSQESKALARQVKIQKLIKKLNNKEETDYRENNIALFYKQNEGKEL